jgi:glycerol uptake facilitator protein
MDTAAPEVTAEGEAPLFRRLLAEFTGTALLVAVGAGTVTALAVGPATRLGAVAEAFPQAMEDPFSQFLFETAFVNVLPVAFAFALVLAVIVYAFGGVSGGHFNPAVTFALAAVRRFDWKDVAPYWGVQCLGAIMGAFIIAGIYSQEGASIGGRDILFGATTVAEGIGQWQAILAEAFIGFALMTAIMAVAIDPRAPKGWSGLVIGLALGAGILLTAAATGGSANFARSLGPLVTSLLYETGDVPWRDLLVYAVGPLIGAAAAAFLYETVAGLERVAPAPRPGAATATPGATVAVVEEEIVIDEAPEPSEEPTEPGQEPTELNQEPGGGPADTEEPPDPHGPYRP